MISSGNYSKCNGQHYNLPTIPLTLYQSYKVYLITYHDVFSIYLYPFFVK
jgi:hypothetical protein